VRLRDKCLRCCRFLSDQVLTFNSAANNTIAVVRKNRYFIVEVGSKDHRISALELEKCVACARGGLPAPCVNVVLVPLCSETLCVCVCVCAGTVCVCVSVLCGLCSQLKDIVKLVDGLPAARPVGMFTTAHRDTWAAQLPVLLGDERSAAGQQNRSALAAVAASMFILCLDDAPTTSHLQVCGVAWSSWFVLLVVTNASNVMH
jgi:hypothetical protein